MTRVNFFFFTIPELSLNTLPEQVLFKTVNHAALCACIDLINDTLYVVFNWLGV